MPLILLILGPTLVLLGGTAVVAGWRGRRLDDHPVCRKCRFDLFGTPEPRTQCPECGAPLEAAKAIRIGNRKRRTGWMAAGLFAFLLGGAAVAILASDIDFNPYKPFWLLHLEATSPSLGSKGGALRELERRLQNRSLTTTQMDTLMKTVVRLQASHPQSWNNRWTGLFWSLRSYGIGSEAQLRQFIKDGMHLQLRVRNRVEVDEVIPYEIRYEGSRVVMRNRMLSASLVEPIATVADMSDMLSGDTHFMVVDFTNFSFASGFIDVRTPPGSDWPVGKWPVRVTAVCEVFDGMSYGSPAITSFEIELEAEVEIVPDGEASIGLLQDAEALKALKQLQDAPPRLIFERHHQMVTWRLRWQSVIPSQFQYYGLSWPQKTTYQIIARDGDSEWNLGTIYSMDQIHARTLDTDFQPRRIDLILRPDPEAARKTVDIDEIIDHEIMFKNVGFEWAGGD